MKTIIKTLLPIFAILCFPAAAAEIHRCTDENGNMIFSQFPCAEEEATEEEPEPEAAAEDAGEAVMSDNIDAAPEVREGKSVAECKKPYRDAIDSIEARMLNGYTADQAEAYKEELLGLTKGLRSCES